MVTMAEKKTQKKAKMPAKDLQAVRSAAAKMPAKTAPARKAVKKAAPAAPKKPATELQGIRSVAAKKAEKAAKPVEAAKAEKGPAEVKQVEAKRPGKAGEPRKLGFNIPLPTSRPGEYDAHCPFFGKVTVRGRILTGTVVSAKMHRTVKIVIHHSHYLKKYERYEKRRTKLLVHNPPSINAQVGDTVRVMETRPISKTKHFVVVERIPPKVPAVTETEVKGE